jgi:alpha-amylase/alpha-mannosidase (GH57 family)
VSACLRANRVRLIDRFEPFKSLAHRAAAMLESDGEEVDAPVLIADLAMWYHLAWLGETVRRGDPRVQQLLHRGEHFSAAERRLLLEIIGEILAGLLPRYRRLMGSGQVELAVSPWGHPILPLMLDFNSAREAWPEVSLPAPREYPGGDDRANWHLARAVQVFTRTFGVRPRGCWPSEGAVSAPALALIERFGFDWVATGQGVLRNSVKDDAVLPYRAFYLPGQQLRCFFRDDGLSDRIGFTYSTWHGDDAVNNLVHELEKIDASTEGGQRRVASIVLDGENAWEHYPFNGFYFLDGLYRRLSDHPRLRLSTFSQCLTDKADSDELPRLTAGSWVYGTFSTWIGDPAKNRAWEMLCDAKHVYDQVVVEGALTPEQERAVEEQLGVCEGSDWFWWFGDDNPAEAVAGFDALYRRHLRNLYRLLGEAAPGYLDHPFAHGGGSAEHGGTMKRSSG